MKTFGRKLSALVRLQLLYALMGISYNVVSLYSIQQGSPALSPTAPSGGIAALSIYAVALLAARLPSKIPYRILMGLSVVLFGYGGVIAHLMNVPHLELYSSPLAWAMAIAINAFGLLLNLYATLGRYDTLPPVTDG